MTGTHRPRGNVCFGPSSSSGGTQRGRIVRSRIHRKRARIPGTVGREKSNSSLRGRTLALWRAGGAWATARRARADPRRWGSTGPKDTEGNPKFPKVEEDFGESWPSTSASVSIAQLQGLRLGTPTILSFLTKFDAYILASIDTGLLNDLGPCQERVALEFIHMGIMTGRFIRVPSEDNENIGVTC